MSVLITIVIPAFNEKDNIIKIINQTQEVCADNAYDYEIVIIDDGSRDGTSEAVKSLLSGKVKLIHHGSNFGYGAAIRSGIKYASKDFICLIAADCQYSPDTIPMLLERIRDADIIAPYRKKRKDPFIRILMGKIYTKLINLIFRQDFKDINCGIKLFKKTSLSTIIIKSNGNLIDAELLLKAKKKGYRINQIGVKHLPRTKGKATGISLRNLLRVINEFMGLYKELKNYERQN